MSKIYEPENQFLERLEWQLSSEYRRANRLKSAHEKVAVSRRMVAVSLMVGTLMTGVAILKATEVIRDSWRKKIEIARIETEVKLKQAHLQSTSEISSRIAVQYANGLIPEQEYQGMQVALDKAGLDLQRSELNLEEVRASGKTPRNKLYAPLVRGRDFVSERLQFEIRDVQLGIGLIKEHYESYKEKVDVGLIEERELDYIQTEINSQNMKINNIQEKLDLRSRFLSGEFTAQEIEIKDRMSAAKRKLHLAQSKMDMLTKQMNEMENHVARGMIHEMELTQMQYVLNAGQAELDLAALELDILKKIK